MRTLITATVTACAGAALLTACGAQSESSTGAQPSAVAITPTTAASAPAASGSPAPTSTPASGAERDAGACASAELAVSAGPSQGESGMQKADATFTLTNKGTRSCTLDGFPGVSFVTGNDGTQVGEPARRNAAAPQLVTLAPGAAVATFLLITNPGAFDEAECGPVDVRGLRIYPPGETAALFLEGATRTCGTPPRGESLLTVGPVGVLP